MVMSLLFFFKVISKTSPNFTSPFFSFLVFSLKSCVCGETEREHTRFAEVKKKGELYTYQELPFAEGVRASGHWFISKELGRKGHLSGDNRLSPRTNPQQHTVASKVPFSRPRRVHVCTCGSVANAWKMRS